MIKDDLSILRSDSGLIWCHYQRELTSSVPVQLYQLWVIPRKLSVFCCCCRSILFWLVTASIEPERQPPEREDEYGQDHRLAGEFRHSDPLRECRKAQHFSLLRLNGRKGTRVSTWVRLTASSCPTWIFCWAPRPRRRPRLRRRLCWFPSAGSPWTSSTSIAWVTPSSGWSGSSRPAWSSSVKTRSSTPWRCWRGSRAQCTPRPTAGYESTSATSSTSQSLSWAARWTRSGTSRVSSASTRGTGNSMFGQLGRSVLSWHHHLICFPLQVNIVRRIQVPASDNWIRAIRTLGQVSTQ